MALNVNRPVWLPRYPTKALGGPRADTTSKLLLEEPSLPDYPSLLLLEDHHGFLLEG